jgi:CBS domain-containing protein
MTDNIKVSQVMTKNVIVAARHSTFTEVMRFFTEFKIQHLPVADGPRIVGIISVSDMMSFIFRATKKSMVDNASLDAMFQIADVMTPSPITISPEDDVASVVNLLSTGAFQAVPVTEGDVIVGIITNKDLVRMLQWEYTH